MTIAEILQRCVDRSLVQFLHECMLGAKLVNGRGSQGKRKGHPTHTRVEFVTTNMTPDDLLYYSGEFGQPASRTPRYVGLIVWVPFEEYDAATKDVVTTPARG